MFLKNKTILFIGFIILITSLIHFAGDQLEHSWHHYQTKDVEITCEHFGKIKCTQIVRSRI